ncbi:hypothetical protein Bca4012_037030 [Brassica carinata]
MQVFQIWKISGTTYLVESKLIFVEDFLLHKVLTFSQTKTLQIHSNLFDLKTTNFI